MVTKFKDKYSSFILIFILTILSISFKPTTNFILDKDNAIMIFRPYLSDSFQINVLFSISDKSPGITTSHIIGLVFDEPYGNTNSSNSIFSSASSYFTCSMTNSISSVFTLEPILTNDLYPNKQAMLCRFTSNSYLISGESYSLILTSNTNLNVSSNYFKAPRLISAFSVDSFLNDLYIEDFVILSPFTLMDSTSQTNILTSNLSISPLSGPCANSESCSDIYLGNDIEIAVDIVCHSYIVQSEVSLLITYPINSVTYSKNYPLSIETKQNGSDATDSLSLPLSSLPNTSLKIELITVDSLIIRNIGENFIPSRKFKLIIKGLKVKDSLNSEYLNGNEFSFKLFYSNSFSIISYSTTSLNFSKIIISSGYRGIKHPEDWDLFQNGAWPLQFTFTVNSDIPNGGIIKIQQKNAKIKESLFTFIASTCDFSVTTKTGTDIFDSSFGKRPTCRPVRTNFAFPNYSTSASFDGSALYFKVSEMKANYNYSFIVWGYAEYCGAWESSSSLNYSNIKDGTKSFYPDPTKSAVNSQVYTYFNFKYELYSEIDSSQENEKKFISKYLLAESSIIKSTSVCWGSKMSYGANASLLSIYDNVTLKAYTSAETPADWKDSIIYKEFYDFNLGLSYTSDLNNISSLTDRNTYCNSTNTSDPNCYLVDINQYSDRFTPLYINSEYLSSIPSEASSVDKHFLLKSNVDLIKTDYLIEYDEEDEENYTVTSKDRLFYDTKYGIELGYKVYPFNTGLSVLPLPVGTECHIQFYTDEDSNTTFPIASFDAKYQAGFINVLFPKQFFESVTDTTDCIFSWANYFNLKDTDNPIGIIQKHLLITSLEDITGNTNTDYDEYVTTYNTYKNNFKNYIKYGSTINSNNSGLKIESYNASNSHFNNVYSTTQTDIASTTYQKLNILSTLTNNSEGNNHLLRSQGDFTYLADIANFQTSEGVYYDNDNQSQYDENRLINVSYYSNCIKLRDLSYDSFKSIYTAFDFQVQWLVTSPNYSTNGKLNRNTRFIKFYPEIGIFNSSSTVDSSNLVSYDSVNMVYKYRLSYQNIICLLEISNGLIDNVVKYSSSGNSNSSSINSLLIFLNTASFLETDIVSEMNYYPAVGINQSKVKAYSYNSAHPLTSRNEMTMLRVTSDEEGIRTDYLNMYAYYTSPEYIRMHNVNQTFYHMFLGPLLILNNSNDNDFMNSGYKYSGSDEDNSSNPENMNNRKENLIIPMLCPYYSTAYLDDSNVSSSDSINQTLPGRIDPTIYLSSTTFSQNTLKFSFSNINVTAAFNDRIDINKAQSRLRRVLSSSSKHSNFLHQQNHQYYNNRLLQSIPYYTYNKDKFILEEKYKIYFTTLRWKKHDYSSLTDKINYCLGGRNTNDFYVDPYDEENNQIHHYSNYNYLMLDESISIQQSSFSPSIAFKDNINEDGLNYSLTYSINKLPEGKFYFLNKPFTTFMANSITENKRRLALCTLLDDNGDDITDEYDDNLIYPKSNFDAPNNSYIKGIIRPEVVDVNNISSLKLLDSIVIGFIDYVYTSSSGTHQFNLASNSLYTNSTVFNAFVVDYNSDIYDISIVSTANEGEYKNDITSSQQHLISLNFPINSGSYISFSSNSFNSNSLCGMETTSGFLNNCSSYISDSEHYMKCIYKFDVKLKASKLKICCYNTDNSKSEISLSDIKFNRNVSNTDYQNSLINWNWNKVNIQTYTASSSLVDLNSSSITSSNKLNINLIEFDQASNKGDYGILRLYIDFPKTPVRNSVFTLEYKKYGMRISTSTPDCKTFFVNNTPISLSSYYYSNDERSSSTSYNVGMPWTSGDFTINNCSVSLTDTSTSGVKDLSVVVTFKDLLYKCGLSDYFKYLLIELYPVKLYDLKSNIGGTTISEMKYYFNLSWKLKTTLSSLNICNEQLNYQPSSSALPTITTNAIKAEDKDNICLISIENPFIEDKIGTYLISIKLEQFVEVLTSSTIQLKEITLFLNKRIFGNLDLLKCYDESKQELICSEHLGFVNIQLLTPISVLSTNTSNTFYLYLSGIPIIDLSRKIFSTDIGKMTCSVNSFVENKRATIINGFFSVDAITEFNFSVNNSSISSEVNYKNPFNIRIINISYSSKEDVSQKLNYFTNDYSYAKTSYYIREKTNLSIRVTLENFKLDLPYTCKGNVYIAISIPNEYFFSLNLNSSSNKDLIDIKEFVANDDGNIKLNSDKDFNENVVSVSQYNSLIIITLVEDFELTYKFRYLDITFKNIINPDEEGNTQMWEAVFYNNSLTCIAQTYKNVDTFKASNVIDYLAQFEAILQKQYDTGFISSDEEEVFKGLGNYGASYFSLVKNHRGLYYTKNPNKIYFDIIPTTKSYSQTEGYLIISPGRYNQYQISLKSNDNLITNSFIKHNTKITMSFGTEESTTNEYNIRFLSGDYVEINSKLGEEGNKYIYLGTSCNTSPRLVLANFHSTNDIFSDLLRVPIKISEQTYKETVVLYSNENLTTNIDSGTKLFSNSRNFFYYGLSAYNFDDINVNWSTNASNPVTITSPVISANSIKNYFIVEVRSSTFSGETKFIPSVLNNNCYEFNTNVRYFTVMGDLIELNKDLNVNDIFMLSYHHDVESLDSSSEDSTNEESSSTTVSNSTTSVNSSSDQSPTVDTNTTDEAITNSRLGIISVNKDNKNRNIQAASQSDYNPGNYDFSSELNRLELDINPPISSPLFLFCTIICQSAEFMTNTELISTPAINKNSTTEINLFKYINSISSINISFDGLLRGNNYKMKCVLSSTEYDESTRTNLEFVKENIAIEKTIDKFCAAFKFSSILNPSYQFKLLSSCQELFYKNYENNGCLACVDKYNQVIDGYSVDSATQCSDNSNEIIEASVKSSSSMRRLNIVYDNNDSYYDTIRQFNNTNYKSNTKGISNLFNDRFLQTDTGTETTTTDTATSSSDSASTSSVINEANYQEYLNNIELTNTLYSICVYQDYTCKTKEKSEATDYTSIFKSYIESVNNEYLQDLFSNSTFYDYIGGAYIKDTVKINSTNINFTEFTRTDDNNFFYSSATFETYLQCYMRASKDYVDINNPPTSDFIISCLGSDEINCGIYFISPDDSEIKLSNKFDDGYTYVWSYCEYNINNPSTTSDIFVLYTHYIPIDETVTSSDSSGISVIVNCNPNLGIDCFSSYLSIYGRWVYLVISLFVFVSFY